MSFLGHWFNGILLLFFVEVALHFLPFRMHQLLSIHFLVWLLLLDEVHQVTYNIYKLLLGLQIPNSFGSQLCFFEMELRPVAQKYWFIFNSHALVFCTIVGIKKLKKFGIINWGLLGFENFWKSDYFSNWIWIQELVFKSLLFKKSVL